MTAILDAAASGGEAALNALVPLVYDELHEMAHWQLVREHRNGTLQTTALLHEAYMRLARDTQVTRQGRAYFFAAAARAMREVLIDAARRRTAIKRGAGAPLANMALDHEPVDAFAAEILDLHDALEDLERREARHARVVECRFFGGMSVAETALALGVSDRTVKADWALARAWLYQVLTRA